MIACVTLSTGTTGKVCKQPREGFARCSGSDLSYGHESARTAAVWTSHQQVGARGDAQSEVPHEGCVGGRHYARVLECNLVLAGHNLSLATCTVRHRMQLQGSLLE